MRKPGARLERAEFAHDAARLARDLLGREFVRVLDAGELVSGIIVETEAYLGPLDRAAHTFGHRQTPRVASMWKAPGTAYVYFTYGMHHCINVVCGKPSKERPAGGEQGTAVLIRALQPWRGLEHMRQLRGPSIIDRDLCRGPGRLCQALAIDRALDGVDLCEGKHLWIAEQPTDWPTEGEKAGKLRVATSPRIGVSGAGEEWASKPYRYFVADSPYVSGRRSLAKGKLP